LEANDVHISRSNKLAHLGGLYQNREMLTMTLSFRGKVQKVGFRNSVFDYVLSQKLPIVGFVHNMADGSVEVIAQGDIEALKELHRFCTKNPPHAEVREVDEELEKISKLKFSDFVVLTE